MAVVSDDVQRPPAPGDPPFLERDRTLWESPRGGWREHLLLIGLTAFAACAAVAAAVCWLVADRTGCRSDVVCVINLNGGLTTLYGLLLTVIGLALTLLLRSVDDESAHERFVRVRRQAAYETWHNLQHFASSWRRVGHLRNRADIRIDRAAQLAVDPLAKWLSTSQSEHVDHMLRNVAVLQRLPWNDDSVAARDHVRWFIEQALRFLVDVGRDDPAVRDMYTRFRVRPGESEQAVKGPLRDLAHALTLPGRRWTVRFAFSERLQAADAANCHVVCWQVTPHDRGPETVHPLGRSLMGLQDPP